MKFTTQKYVHVFMKVQHVIHTTAEKEEKFRCYFLSKKNMSAKLLKFLSAVNQHSSTEVKHTRNHHLMYLHNLDDVSFEKKKKKSSKACFLNCFLPHNWIDSIRSNLQKQTVGALGMQIAWVCMENLWKIVSSLLR